MAITVGTHISLTPQANAGSPYSETVDLGDTTTAIVACVTIYDTSATDGVVSGVTYGGQAMTNSVTSYEADCDGHLSIWYLNTPSVSSTKIEISFGGTVTDLMGSVTEITGGYLAEDSVPAVASSGHGSPSISWTTSEANTLVFGCMLSDQGVGSKITCDSTGSIYIEDVGSDTVGAAVAVASSAGAQGISWSDTDNDEDWTAHGAAYKEGLAQVYKDVEAKWDIHNLVNKDNEAKWDILNIVNKDNEAKWDILNLVNKDNEAKWDIAELVNKDIEAKWDMAELVYKDNVAKWDILNLVNKDIQAVWDINENGGVVATTEDMTYWMLRKMRLGF